MPSTPELMTFVGIVLLGAMNPGLDFTMVVRQSALLGRRGGIVTALGIGTGVLVWVAAAATGVTALIALSATAFAVMKAIGAAYLVYLGVTALRAAIRGDSHTQFTVDPGGASLWVAFRRGLLCNLLNPKVSVFFMALMPHFVGSAPEVGATALLSMLAAATTSGWFVLVATIIGTMRRVFARRRVRRATEAATGTALIAMGVGVATART